MHTFTVDPKLQTQPRRHAHPAFPTAVPPVLPTLTPFAKQHKAAADQVALPSAKAQPARFEEMDAMLSEEPGLGAIKGLRVALLFNAGLALTGLIAWEIWTFLLQ